MAQRKSKVVCFSNVNGIGFVSVEGPKDVFCQARVIHGNGYLSIPEGKSVDFAGVEGVTEPFEDTVKRLD